MTTIYFESEVAIAMETITRADDSGSLVQDHAPRPWQDIVTYGTGSNQINCKWSGNIVVPTAGYTLDLLDLIDTDFGENLNFAFAAIKLIQIRHEAAAGEGVKWTSSQANPFLGPFGGSNISYDVAPGALTLEYLTSGWSISGSNKNFRLQASGMNAVTAYVFLAGVKV